MMCTYVHTNSILHTIFLLLADPFVISHPDLPIDAALGENLKMMFVVGTNSDGTTNLARQTATGTIAVELYFNDSTLLYSKRFEQDLPYTIENQIPISTASEGYYTFRACKSANFVA